MHSKDSIPTHHRPAGRLALLPLTLLVLTLLSGACSSPEQVAEAPTPETGGTSGEAPEAGGTSDGDSGDDPPPWSDTITHATQFLSCTGNPYALCYYSGPEDAPPNTNTPVPAMPCYLNEDGTVASCKCYAQEDGLTTNYVALPSILNDDIRRETEIACGSRGERCLNIISENKSCADDPDADHCKTAPVCNYLGNVAAGTGQTFYPEGKLISTFSLVHSLRYPIGSTPCDAGITYAGCMTADCGEVYAENGERFVDCACPTYSDGPFQFGQSNPALSCDPGGGTVWSAANVTIEFPPSSDGGAR